MQIIFVALFVLGSCAAVSAMSLPAQASASSEGQSASEPAPSSGGQSAAQPAPSSEGQSAPQPAPSSGGQPAPQPAPSSGAQPAPSSGGQTAPQPSDSRPSGGCPGGYEEGAEVERGRFVYACQGGAIVPKGCIAEDLSRVPLGGHYDNKHYRRACVTSGTSLTFEVTGCIQNGQEHKPEETWDDGTSFFTCKTNAAGAEPQLVSANEGCVAGGKRVPKKEKVTKEDGIFLCDEAPNGGSKLVQAGCFKEGKALNAGEAFEAGKFWYNCTRIGREKYVVKPAGCINSGKRINDGERYFENNVVYECLIDDDKTGVRVTGCVATEGGTTIERKLGCIWSEGTAPNQYEVLCQHDPANNTAKKVFVRCNYNVGAGSYNIDPGCFRTVDKGAVGCAKDGEGLKIQSFQGKDAQEAEKAASSAGFHAC